MGIRHTVPAGLPVTSMPNRVGGAEWSADHLHIPFHCTMFHMGTSAFTAPTAIATTELTVPMSRILVDLSQATQCRLVVGQKVLSTAGTGTIRLQYATNGATQTTWADADGGGISMLGGTANTIKESGWVSLVAGAQIDNCYLRLVTAITATITTAAQYSFADVMFR
jgi:hypothetical protein